MTGIVRFPAFLLLDDGKRFASGCKIYPNFAALVRTMTQQERERALRWHVKQKGGYKTSYKAALLRFSEPCEAIAKKIAEGAA